MAVGKDGKNIMKCYYCNTKKMQRITEEELSIIIDRYGIQGYPIYVNGAIPSIYIYTAVIYKCVLIIGCKVFDDKEYTVNDVKQLNRLGLVGKKIYDDCVMEV